MVGHQTLDLGAQVRILDRQPKALRQVAGKHTAPSSSGPGHRPLKAEIAGSNPAGATRKRYIGQPSGWPFCLDWPCDSVVPTNSGQQGTRGAPSTNAVGDGFKRACRKVEANRHDSVEIPVFRDLCLTSPFRQKLEFRIAYLATVRLRSSLVHPHPNPLPSRRPLRYFSRETNSRRPDMSINRVRPLGDSRSGAGMTVMQGSPSREREYCKGLFSRE